MLLSKIIIIKRGREQERESRRSLGKRSKKMGELSTVGKKSQPAEADQLRPLPLSVVFLLLLLPCEHARPYQAERNLKVSPHLATRNN